MKRGIEVEIQRFYNVLVGKCNYIPDELRGQLNLWDEETRYEISSDNEPCFYDDMSLSICGTKKEKDDLNFCYAYDTYEKAIEARKVFQKLIYQFNEQYCKEQILDDIEKEYLENVLRPLRCKEVQIEKVDYMDNTEYIAIHHKNILNEKDIIILPPFKEGTMYKNMEFDKYYTLDELGLFKEAQA